MTAKFHTYPGVTEGWDMIAGNTIFYASDYDSRYKDNAELRPLYNSCQMIIKY